MVVQRENSVEPNDIENTILAPIADHRCFRTKAKSKYVYIGGDFVRNAITFDSLARKYLPALAMPWHLAQFRP